MTLLQMELSKLEVEILEIVADATPEHNSDLETLTSSKAEAGLTEILSVKSTIPTLSCGSCSCGS